MNFELNNWYTEKSAGDVLYEFSGEITNDTIENSEKLIEDALERFNFNSKVKKKVYNVFVECIQNLFHHVDAPPAGILSYESKNYGVIIVSCEGSFFRITTGNFVKKEKFNFLKDRIDQINSLTDEDIRMLYREILSNLEFSEKGGGGLGIVDIVRKTGNKLEYFFHNYDSKNIFFSLDVYIC